MASTLFGFTLTSLNGDEVKLDKYRGKCLLIVNFAPDCKLVRDNFAQLRSLKKKFSNDLAILLFPCSQFSSSCETSDVIKFVDRENIDFADTFAIVDVNGPDAHPIFTFLKSERPGCISWNFSKFLVDKSGNQIERFNHRILFAAIETEIKKMI